MVQCLNSSYEVGNLVQNSHGVTKQSNWLDVEKLSKSHSDGPFSGKSVQHYFGDPNCSSKKK